MEILSYVIVYGGLLLIGFIPAYAASTTYRLANPKEDEPEEKPSKALEKPAIDECSPEYKVEEPFGWES
jgi:hypothetical protein